MLKMISKLFGKQLAQTERSNNWIFGTILAAAILGLIASAVLSVEKIHLLQNPNAQLSCNFNVFLNCASVMKTGQASVFGFPNSFIGIATYSVLITLAVGYFAGARYKKWFMVGAQVGAFLGLVFAYWLFFQSVYVIQVLCPWCLIVTFVTTLIFEALLRYNLRENTINLSKKVHAKGKIWLAKDYDKLLTASWIVLMILLVFLQFRDSIF